MVLQQQSDVALWGTATKNSKVVIVTSLNKKEYVFKADDDGNWNLKVSTPATGGPYKINISDGEKTVLDNVLIGEVWVCSGQSNMEMPMRGFKNQPILNSNEILVNADNTNLRLFRVSRATSLNPQKNCKGEWQPSTPATAREFSAVAYQFGKTLQEKLKVPVGLILSTVGSTKIQTWMSAKSLSAFPQVKIPASLDTFTSPHKEPTSLFNGMISPVLGYSIKGFIWYQGESNRDDADLYEKLFPAMVKDWRAQWNQGELPFYYAQIAPFGSALNEIPKSGMRMREVQLKSMQTIPNSGMAVTIDVGMEKFIYFMDKTKVANRLAYWALAKTYGIKGISYSGPVYKTMKVSGNKATLTFDYTDNGITSYGKDFTLFEIAGQDKTFYPATAKINADGTLEMASEKVKTPVAIRYAFKNFVIGELYNTDGLPASSFRTDDWDH